MDLKKMADSASALLNRAVQYTGEKLGNFEHTELDAHFEQLLQRADTLKHQTERLKTATIIVLQPDPTQRAEDLLYGTIAKTGIENSFTKKPVRLTPLDNFGATMTESAAALGPGSAYGSTLLRVGQTQQQLATLHRDFVQTGMKEYVAPLQGFLDGEIKRIATERKNLESSRLDLDAAKSKLKRARTERSKSDAEVDLRKAQTNFDRQAEVTRILLEGLASVSNHHSRLLVDMVESQAAYYANCNYYTQDLLRQLGSHATQRHVPSIHTATTENPGSHQPSNNPSQTSYSYPATPSAPVNNDTPVPRSCPTPPTPNNTELGGFALLAEPPTQRAKVLYSYSKDHVDGLDLVADEIVDVWPHADTNWLMAQKGGKQGRVPISYLEILRK